MKAKYIWTTVITFLAALVALFLLSILYHWVEGIMQGVQLLGGW